MRKTFIILFSVAAVALFLLVVVPLFLLKKSFDDLGEKLGGGSKDYVNERVSTSYVFEEGMVAYRPSSTGQIIAANIFSLGTVGRPEWLVGRTMTQADAKSFEVLAQRYGRDKVSVYFGAAKLAFADRESFAVLEFGYSRDKNKIWYQNTRIIDWLHEEERTVKAYSPRHFTVDNQAYFLKGNPLDVLELAEMPRTEITNHCRDWFEMNDALWFAETRLDVPAGPIDVVDCDGSIRSGPDGEFVEDNKGLMFTAGSTAYLARVTGDVSVAHAFDADVVDAVFFAPDHRENLMIARLADDRVVVVDLTGDRHAQELGAFPDLAENAFKTGSQRALWLQDRFFVYNEDKALPIYADYGEAQREGRYVIADRAVFSGAFEMVGADPATFEILRGDVSRDRQACFAYGRYVGDLLDGEIDGDAAYEKCWALYDQSHLVYDGMKIRFQRNFKRVLNGGAADEGDEFIYDYVIGTVEVENLTDAALPIDPDFYANIDGWVSSGRAVKIDVDRPVLAHNGSHALAPNAMVSWPLKVRSDVPNLTVGFYMSVTHFGAKRDRFGDQPMRFASTSMSNAPLVAAD